jgi:hypothetical protein
MLGAQKQSMEIHSWTVTSFKTNLLIAKLRSQFSFEAFYDFITQRR